MGELFVSILIVLLGFVFLCKAWEEKKPVGICALYGTVFTLFGLIGLGVSAANLAQ